MVWTVGLVILLAVIAWVVSRFRAAIESAAKHDQAVTSVVSELARDADDLVEEAAKSSPEVYDRWLRERIGQHVSDINGIEEAFRELVTLVSQKLCLSCVETWVRLHESEGATELFAVHDFMRDYDLAESVGNSGAYEYLSAGQRSALEAMPESDRLEGSMRSRAAEWLGGDEGAVRRLGQVGLPVAADIYGRV